MLQRRRMVLLIHKIKNTDLQTEILPYTSGKDVGWINLMLRVLDRSSTVKEFVAWCKERPSYALWVDCVIPILERQGL